MAFKRRRRGGYGFRRRFRRRRRTGVYRRTRRTRVAAYRALKGVRRITAHWSPQFETDVSTVAAGAIAAGGWTIFHLTAIGQGVPINGRLGQKILMKSIQLRTIYTPANTFFNRQLFRVVLFRDKQQIGDTIPGSADLFRSTTDMMSFRNYDTRGRFKFLYDKVFSASRSSVYYDGVTVQLASDHRTFKISLRMHTPILYNGTLGTDIQKNGIYLAIFPFQSAVSLTMLMRRCWHNCI